MEGHVSKSALDLTLASKEDVLLQLADSPGQSRSLGLLHDHIKDMTSLVRRLSRDIDRCEATLNSNTAGMGALSTRIAGLENSALSSSTDSKINRCDIGIKELVREVRQCTRDIAKLRLAQETQTNIQTDRHTASEGRFAEVEKVVKRVDSEQNAQIRQLKEHTQELGTASLKLELGMNTDMRQFQDQCLTKVERLLKDLDQKFEQNVMEKQSEIDKLNEILDTQIGQVNLALGKLRSQQSVLEDKVKEGLSHSASNHKNDLGRLRGECMSGFKTLQDSIDTMHSILDSKIHLVEDEIRGEIRKAMKTIIVT